MKKLSSIIAEINSEYDRAVWNDELSKRKLSVIDGEIYKSVFG